MRCNTGDTGIIVAASNKGKIDSLYIAWVKQLTQGANGIGIVHDMPMVGPQLGDKVQLFFTSEFLPVLKASNVSFKELTI